MSHNEILQVSFAEEVFHQITRGQTTADCFFEEHYETEVDGYNMLRVCHPGCEYAEHIPNEHVIVIHEHPELGSVRKIGDRLQVENVEVGDLAILPAGIPHWQGIEQPISGATIVSVAPTALANVFPEAIAPKKVELLPTFATPDPLIQHLGLQLREEIAGSETDLIYVESLLTAFSLHLLKHYSNHSFKQPSYQGGLAPYKLKEILAYIDSHLAEGDLSLSKMAELTELSTYYFARQFKQSTGYAPHKYVVHQRLEKAKRLLKQRKLSISHVSLECGFSNQSHFGRAFRKEVGTTPKRYREEL